MKTSINAKMVDGTVISSVPVDMNEQEIKSAINAFKYFNEMESFQVNTLSGAVFLNPRNVSYVWFDPRVDK